MTPAAPTTPRKRYVRAIGPRLRVIFQLVFVVSALLAGNSVYLVSVHLLEWLRGAVYQNYFYQCMFLGHLALGLLIVVPFIIFGIGHMKNAHDRPNRRAVRVGYALLVVCVVLLVSGLALVRFEPFVIKGPAWRSAFYWAHVGAPLAVVWLYVLHRLAGPRIKWKAGLRWAVPAALIIAAMVYLNSRDPRKWNVSGPREGERYFHPSLARTASGNFIPAAAMMNDQYCMECHRDNYQGWFHSAHHFSSFNNPAYLFSVRETRRVSLKRDGNVSAARWCAGCHDAVPFFSGAFDNPNYDDVHDPTAGAGLTCTTCHAITHVNSTRGNADYTIEEPIQYPFAFSKNSFLKFVNRQLIKAKPEFHKQTFLKPLHKSAEFCSTCHKVSIPGELNHYKEFLRGQNHYDTYLLSGVSGHNARAFYYPPTATLNCAGCHMPAKPSDDFGAMAFDPSNPGQRMVHDHFFPGGNTAIAALRGDQATANIERDFLKGVVRVDLFGIKTGGRIDSPLNVVRPAIPSLRPGQDYLLEVVIRTLKLGHPFTQGTTDSNEVWLDVKATSGSADAIANGSPGGAANDAAGATSGTDVETVLGRSGGLSAANAVDPWAYFANTYMLDRDGNRIDRRNVQDIFTPLYSHQIPPGAAAVVHYHLHVPQRQTAPVTVEMKLQYRKFSTRYMQYIQGDATTNTLPITTMAMDRVTFAIEKPSENKPLNDSAQSGTTVRTDAPEALSTFGSLSPVPTGEGRGERQSGESRSAAEFPRHRTAIAGEVRNSPKGALPQPSPLRTEKIESEKNAPPPQWQRWNDYGIGLLLEGNQPSDRGELLQAAQAFAEVEKLGHADGAMNLARVYFKEGRVDDAAAALDRAAHFSPPAPGWTVAWLSGLIDAQNGNLDRAINELQSVVEGRWPAAEGRGFDFSKDYEVLNALGQALFDRAKAEPAGSPGRKNFLLTARTRFDQTLSIDSENLAAHYVLAQIDDELGLGNEATQHRAAHAHYRPDDNARDRAVALARQRDKAADHAAGAVVIYELTASPSAKE